MVERPSNFNTETVNQPFFCHLENMINEFDIFNLLERDVVHGRNWNAVLLEEQPEVVIEK